MNKRFVKNALMVVFFLVLVGAVPFGLKYIYTEKITATVFRPGEVLGYLGAIITVLGAVIGVLISTRNAYKNYQEDFTKRVMPYIAVDVLRRNNVGFSIGEKSKKNEVQETNDNQDYKLQDYYCILENGEIKYRVGFTEKEYQLINNNWIELEDTETGVVLVAREGIYLPMEIENIGNGAAVNLRFGLNRKSEPAEKWEYVPAISLKVGEPIRLLIFSADLGENSKNAGEYLLDFQYEDYFENKYRKKINVTLGHCNKRKSPYYAMDMSQRQYMVEDK